MSLASNLASTMIHSVRDNSRLAASIAEFYMHGAVLGPLGRRYWAWRYRNSDPWNYANSPYEQQKYERTLAMLPPAPTADRVHPRVLEVGCSEGVFTELLARSPKVGSVVGVDVAQSAVERAQARCAALDNVSLHLGDVREVPLDGGFTAAFCAETLSHMGSWHSLRSICDTLARLMASGGSLVLVDSYPKGRFLHKPFRMHRDFELTAREVFDDPVRPYMISVLTRR